MRSGSAQAILLAVMCVTGVAVAHAQEAPAPEKPSYSYEQTWKLTFGLYRTPGDTGTDLNLRGSFGNVNAWVGGYAETAAGRAHDGIVRLGAEYAFKSPWVRITPTVAYATNDFWGGQLYTELGRKRYLIAGYSRTNLADYFNLTFDPNESVQIGAGGSFGAHNVLQAYSIFDVRLGTGQQVTHVVVRHWLSPGHRLTIDGSYKTGHNGDGQFVHGPAAQATFDWPRFFVRAAADSHANFGDSTMVRVGGGVRF